MFFPKYKRTLPDLKCPFCGHNLMEFRLYENRQILLGWKCNCEQFIKCEKEAIINITN